jgi:hypothetical protein
VEKRKIPSLFLFNSFKLIELGAYSVAMVGGGGRELRVELCMLVKN